MLWHKCGQLFVLSERLFPALVAQERFKQMKLLAATGSAASLIQAHLLLMSQESLAVADKEIQDLREQVDELKTRLESRKHVIRQKQPSYVQHKGLTEQEAFR